MTLKQSKRVLNTQLKLLYIYFVHYFKFNCIFIIFADKIVKKIVPIPPSHYKVYNHNSNKDIRKKGTFFNMIINKTINIQNILYMQDV